MPCFRLDDLLRSEHIGLMKIDVEGFELRVLMGSGALVERSRPLIYVENDRAEQSRELIEWLWGIGYNLWWHLPPLFNPENFCGVTENIYGGYCLHQYARNSAGSRFSSPTNSPEWKTATTILPSLNDSANFCKRGEESQDLAHDTLALMGRE